MNEIKMPQLGQSVEEASVVTWLKKEGDTVTEGEPLFSIQTDKAEIECESTATGVLRKILVEPDVFVPVMTVVALVGEPDEPLPDLAQYAVATAEAAQGSTPAQRAPKTPDRPPEPSAVHPSGGPTFVSPRARARAKALDIDPAFAAGSGAGGRVMEADVLDYGEKVSSVKITPTARRLARAKALDLTSIPGTGPRGKIMKADVAEAAPQPPRLGVAGAVKRIPLTPMRRIIAERMSESFLTAPHYYITVEVDMTAAKKLRSSCAAFKPSYNDMVMRATALALERFPSVNARWAGDAIEEVEDINLGLAVALPAGIIVPVIKRAQNKSLAQIHQACRDLVKKARDGKLTPDDYTGNTFTISNLGSFGVDEFTAIINPPDSAILAVGQIKDRATVIDGDIQARPIMKMTLSSDHRVIDGAVAAQFIRRLKEILERAEL